MKKLFIALCLIPFMFSCGVKMIDVAVDNPSENYIIVKVDSLEVEVPPREVVWVEMGIGSHKIGLPNDSVVSFDFEDATYMINPTLTEYLKYEEFYGSEAYHNTYTSSITKKSVTYLGLELEGNYEVVKGLINKVSWDYGPREVLPEMIELEDDTPYGTVTKIVDPTELFAMFGSEE